MLVPGRTGTQYKLPQETMDGCFGVVCSGGLERGLRNSQREKKEKERDSNNN